MIHSLVNRTVKGGICSISYTPRTSLLIVSGINGNLPSKKGGEARRFGRSCRIAVTILDDESVTFREGRCESGQKSLAKERTHRQAMTF